MMLEWMLTGDIILTVIFKAVDFKSTVDQHGENRASKIDSQRSACCSSTDNSINAPCINWYKLQGVYQSAVS